MSRIVLVTGSDSGFFEMMMDTIRSVERVRLAIKTDFDIGVMDCGLTNDQQEVLRGLGVKLANPTWPAFVPEHLREPKHGPRFCRTRLPELFPGYDIYLWIDADAWVQDGRFFAEYVKKAESGAIAIVHEAEPAYKTQWRVVKWNLGNMVLSFGFGRGLYLWRQKRINNGVFALRGDAPHWGAWEKYYSEAVRRSGKFYNQLSLTAAIHLDRLPISYVTGEFNWVVSRGAPVFDTTRKLFCTPYDGHAPLSVVHLAGPDKDAAVLIRTTDGQEILGSFLFRNWLPLVAS